MDQLGDEITAFNFAATDIHDGLRSSPRSWRGRQAGWGIYGWKWGGRAWIERLWFMSATAAGASEPICWQLWNEKRARDAISLR
jgi:hypothetical protein